MNVPLLPAQVASAGPAPSDVAPAGLLPAPPAQDPSPQPEPATRTVVDEVPLEATGAPSEPAPAPASHAPRPRRRSGTSLIAVTAISFSLTFVGASVAFLAGVLPPSFIPARPPVDLGVLLLAVPLCALTLALMAEALRAAMTGTPRPHPSRAATALGAWRPGQREG